MLTSARNLTSRRQSRYMAFEARPKAKIRLYCFPFAGGAASVFRQWQPMVPAHVELRACQFPGRHDRMNEPAYTDATRLACQLADDLATEGDERPFAFFGHSMGGLIAFELARELLRRSARLPTVLAVSGRSAPQLAAHRTRLHLLPAEVLLDSLTAVGGMPREVRAVPELVELLLPTLRADLKLAETYRWTSDPSPLPCPIVVFGGAQDPLVESSGLGAWQDCSAEPVSVRIFPGDHFYLWPVGPELIRSMLEYFERPQPGQ
jgi:medium-chain acyl-[acyl-carrier-protein] hydrolase